MIYKRKESPVWYCKFQIGGQVIRESTGTIDRKFAKAFAAKRYQELWNSKKLDIKVYTIADAIREWKKEKAGKRSLERDLEIFAVIPDQDTLLTEWTQADIMKHLRKIAAATSPANANRHLGAIRALLNRAQAWDWIKQVPRLQALASPRFDPRWITQDEFKKLLVELPPHGALMARFAAATGLRYGNIAGFRWDWIRGTVAFIPSQDVKTNRIITVPLNADALAVLEECKGKHAEYAFTDHKGRAPVGSLKTCWHKATQRAGVGGLRFHELRHSWASWHLQAGTPLHILQRLGGWTSYKMVLDVYGHLVIDQLQDYSGNVVQGAAKSA